MKTLASIALSLPLLIAAQSTYACDDKACEKAYLLSTTQYVSNHERQADTARTERHAHALNRERRDYALQKHIHRSKTILSKG